MFIEKILRNANVIQQEYELNLEKLSEFLYERYANKSVPTRRFITSFLTEFVEFMMRQKKVNLSTMTVSFTKQDIVDFIRETNKNKSLSRLDKYITYSNLLLEFVGASKLERAQLIENLSNELKIKANSRKTRKGDKELFKIIEEQFDYIEKLIKNDANTNMIRTNVKFLTALVILYVYGIRTSELEKLYIKDIINEEKFEVMRAKSYKTIRFTIFPNIINNVLMLADRFLINRINLKSSTIYKKKRKFDIDYRDFRRNFSQKLFRSNLFTIEEIEYLMGHSNTLFANYLTRSIVIDDMHERFKKVFAREAEYFNNRALKILKMLNTSI